jgi:hypothetical protein
LTTGGVPHHPEGFGYGTLLVRADGLATYRGYVSDGTRFSGSGWVSEAGDVPLYHLLYRRRGSCVSWLRLRSDGTVSGTWDWFRPAQTTAQYPAGFWLVAELTGRRVADPSLPTGPVRLVVGGSEWGPEATKTFVVRERGRVDGSDGTGRLTVNPRSGEFTGALRSAPGGSLIRCRGFLWPGELAGDGFALGATRAGYARLEPVP